MSKGRSGTMLGVGGTRSNLSRATLHGGRGTGTEGRGGLDPLAQKRELLRKLQERRNTRSAVEGEED
ncbi:DUF6243 family protein [Streptomyces sp. NPDC018031]|uniref:DUF6243 family protein n=1 Tax=Streptomyces sp. NPDC018031 TaxID=3365033 RepID=UPI0037ABBD0D